MSENDTITLIENDGAETSGTIVYGKDFNALTLKRENGNSVSIFDFDDLYEVLVKNVKTNTFSIKTDNPSAIVYMKDPIYFLKITNPEDDDIKYAQFLIETYGKDLEHIKFKRKNFTFVKIPTEEQP